MLCQSCNSDFYNDGGYMIACYRCYNNKTIYYSHNYKCYFCNTFRGNADYVHGHMKFKCVLNPDSDINQGMKECRYCDKSYKLTSSLRGHITNKHKGMENI